MNGAFRSTLYVTINRVDGAQPSHVQVMFYPDRRSDFTQFGLTFSWLNMTLTVCGRGFVTLDAYGQMVEIRNASGALFEVSAFSTEELANAYLANPTPTDASAS